MPLKKNPRPKGTEVSENVAFRKLDNLKPKRFPLKNQPALTANRLQRYAINACLVIVEARYS